ncbi:ATP-binding protein [Streptomyces sp. NPDC054794]
MRPTRKPTREPYSHPAATKSEPIWTSWPTTSWPRSTVPSSATTTRCCSWPATKALSARLRRARGDCRSSGVTCTGSRRPAVLWTPACARGRWRTCRTPLQLVVSEIVTNALIHAGSDVDVRLRAYPDHIRLEVRDSASNPPVPSPLALAEEENAEAEHGRGLLIVEALASAWHTYPNGRGKTVSVDLPVPEM